MDYFYVSSRRKGKRGGANNMSTKELQKRLKDIGKSSQGQRSVLVKRYERYATEEVQEEVKEGDGQGPQAS